jgi:hypothetical protein
MATQSRAQESGKSSSESSGDIGSPITNEAYNVITALQAKLEGLEAYRKYSRDSNAELWRQLVTSELDGVQLLVNELERLVRDGKFRMRRPGQAQA